jgi:aromatic-L-amino-acid decarboxylase
MERTTARGRVMVTGCTAHGRYLGRVCVLSFRTHQAQIDALIDDFAATIEDILP